MLTSQYHNSTITVTTAPVSLTVLHILHRAVELNPDEGHTKYLYLGQMSSGEEAVSHLTKGIEIMTLLMQGQQAEVSNAASEISTVVALDTPTQHNWGANQIIAQVCEQKVVHLMTSWLAFTPKASMQAL